MSVRKRTWSTAKGEEKTAWVVDYTDASGKRRLKSFKLKKDADKFAATATLEVDQGVHVADRATVTVAEACSLWLVSCDHAGLERTTIDGYRQHVELHIKPFIGAARLNKVTVPYVRSFQDKLRKEGRSASMVKRVTVSLGSILSDAQERGLIVRNAVSEMSKRRTRNTTEKRQKRRLAYGIDIPTIEEARAILAAAEGRYRPLLFTAIFTGLRSSELRGLSWSNVDLEKRELHVRSRADKYHTMGMPKSDAGQRTIPLPPMLVNTLKEWKLACPIGELDLVFPNTAGNIEWHANIIKRGLQPTMIKAGVTKEGPDGKLVAKYSGMHAMRHWFASWCINRKADGGLELTPKAVQTRMGHSSIQVTFDTYGHLFPTVHEDKELATAEEILFK
ncbi:tyrosine-type recombinase/integrase [Ahrensia marina]|uniref:Integrase n=1 Tax=Ahrensia marina TaxID=1514904 RepID=A0A0N0VLC1_9HYPH|nr:site-specific integrase [Ahrensia marina]KPA99957.1 integrase [Ahrensia marina]